MTITEKFMNIVQTFQAVGPILGHALKSGQLLGPQCELTEPDPDILCEYDVKIPMSEGFSVTTNIYRSKKAAGKGEKVPVVMCAHPLVRLYLPHSIKNRWPAIMVSTCFTSAVNMVLICWYPKYRQKRIIIDKSKRIGASACNLVSAQSARHKKPCQ